MSWPAVGGGPAGPPGPPGPTVAIPSGTATAVAATTTAAVLTDIPGLTCTITLTTATKIQASMTGTWKGQPATADAGFAISINAVASQENQYSDPGTGFSAAFGVVCEAGPFAAGAYIVKGQFRRTLGAGTVFVDTVSLTAVGLEG